MIKSWFFWLKKGQYFFLFIQLRLTESEMQKCVGNINDSPELKILGVVATYTIHYEVNQVECFIKTMRHTIVQLQKLSLSFKLFAT